MTNANAALAQPFEGLYAFIRAHLLVVNNLIAASCFAVGALDFMAPKLWLLPRIIYSCTAALAAAMLFAALMPGLAAKIQARLFGAAPSHVSLWRRGGWQFAFALLCVVSIVGFASVAKASVGGLAASQFPAVRDLQSELLSIRSSVADISAGVGQANAKLDLLVGAESDPRRALASRGYAVNSSGLMQAIKQNDELAVAWFGRIKVPVERDGVALALLETQPWNPRIPAALDPVMFAKPEACANTYWTDRVLEPVEQRLREYVRLCGKEKVSAYLAVELPRPQPANPAEQWIARRQAQTRNLAIVKSM